MAVDGAADGGAAGAVAAERPPVAPRWGRHRLRTHVLVLAAVLLVGLAASRPGVAYTSDEGAGILQARLLADTGGWRYEYPLADIDPDDVARPFPRGDKGERGVAPYAKHPTYPLVLVAADGVGGTVGMLLTSVAGTLAAAVLAALLARRLGPGLDVPTLWLVGVGSPLLFDAYLVLAHTLGAAAAAGAALAVVRALERPSAVGRWLAAAAGLVLVGALLRTEAVFVGPALAVALALLARRGRLRWPAALGGGAALVAAAGAAVVADRVAERAIVGAPLPTGVADEPVGLVQGRVQAFVATVLDGGYLDHGPGQAAVWLAAGSLVAAAVLLRRRPPPATAVVGLAWVAVAACAVRLVARPDLVPGLVPAFPLLVAGLVLLRWRDLADDVVALLVVAGGLVVVAVWATEYARGGGIEWGGRYFAVALPLLAPLAVLGLSRGVAAVAPARDRRALVGALVAVPVLLGLVAVRAHHTTHERTEDLLAAVEAAAAGTDPGAGLDRPVVVATARLLPQIAYPDFDEYLWVVPSRRDLAPVGERLAARGVEEVVVVSFDLDDLLERLPDWEVAVPPGEEGVAVLRRRPA